MPSPLRLGAGSGAWRCHGPSHPTSCPQDWLALAAAVKGYRCIIVMSGEDDDGEGRGRCAGISTLGSPVPVLQAWRGGV